MSFILHSTRLSMEVFASEFTDNIGAIVLSFGIAVGGIFAAWILISLGECCTGIKSSRRWARNLAGSKKWNEHTGRSKNSVVRLITMCLAILLCTVAWWIAAQTAGFNFWTVVLGYGILSMILNIAFGQLLRDVGAFFLIALTDKIEEGWYIQISELGVEGRVVAIQWLWVEVVYTNEQTKTVEEAQIPTGFIMMNILRRKFAMETKPAVDPNSEIKNQIGTGAAHSPQWNGQSQHGFRV